MAEPARDPPASDQKGCAIARIDDLMERTDSKFHLVHLAAKRAREINAYYAQLGEGMKNFVPPLVATESNKPLTIALEEVAEGKIEAVEPSEETDEDPLAFIEGAGEQAPDEADEVDLEAVSDDGEAGDGQS